MATPTPSHNLSAVCQTHVALWQRLQDFSLDNPQASFPFSRRLAQENSWSQLYTQRVIEEYKRFAFLAVAAGHPVSPSDSVDQAWHLHLLYSRSYWEEFCPKVLGMPLHHQPTCGGAAERDKHIDWYAKTLASYERLFGQPAPMDIWPAAQDHLRKPHRFVRLNAAHNWVIPKRWSRSLVPLTLLAVFLLAFVGCSPLLCQLNPLEMRGADFLWFFVGTTALGGGTAWFLRQRLRLPSEGPDPQTLSLSVEEMAYLADGANRVADVTVVKLLENGTLRWAVGVNKLEVGQPLPSNADLMERAVVEAVAMNAGRTGIQRAVVPHLEAMGRKLQTLGVILTDEQQAITRYWPAFIMGLVLLLGLCKIAVGLSRGKPVEFLVMLCLLVAGGVAAFLFLRPLRSRYGDTVLAYLKKSLASGLGANQEATSAGTFGAGAVGLGLSVALLGVAALTGTPFADVGKWLAPPSSGGGDGSGCSSDGGGGGGCGGCGGD